MIFKRFICLLVLLECIHLSVGAFNLSTAHCINQGQDFLINQFLVWPASSLDGSDGYCYDARDNGYQLGESVLTCSGCLKFSCRSAPCEGRDGSLSKMFWELESVGSECCQTCDGTIVPPNKVVTTAQLGGECRVREVAMCMTSRDDLSEDQSSSIQVSYESDVCCPDKPASSQSIISPLPAWSSLGASYLAPGTCSVRTCSTGSPAHWTSQTQYPGQCNCCVYNGKMFSHGEIVNQDTGEWCCDGSVVATTTSTTTSTTTTTTSTTSTTTTNFIPPTVQSGHTLLRKIVVDTTTCNGCSEGSLTLQLWGADDALVIHDCTTMPLTVTGVGKQGFERELGEYTETHGCREAPLDARVSNGRIIWEGKGKWEAKDICFEWLDDKKFPLDCKIYGDVIASCRTNRNYPGQKCPIV